MLWSGSRENTGHTNNICSQVPDAKSIDNNSPLFPLKNIL